MKFICMLSVIALLLSTSCGTWKVDEQGLVQKECKKDCKNVGN